jgi:hypothetical protein
LAKCKLNIDHPNFERSESQSLISGLHDLISLVLGDHKLSGWVNHPMPGFPAYQNKIWKWDFRPEGDRASTRKGWRLYAFVPNYQQVEPVEAIAFLCYDKDETPKGDHIKFLAKALAKFLSNATKADVKEPPFKRQTESTGEIISLCWECWAMVFRSFDEQEVISAEANHRCGNAN